MPLAASCYATGTSTAITTSETWDAWNIAYATSANTAIWSVWCTTTTATTSGTAATYYYDAGWGQAYVQSPEEIATAKQKAAEDRERREAAKRRATELLEMVLSTKQRGEMAAHRYFTVEGKESKRRYRVHVDRGIHGNIEEVDAQDVPLRSLCCAPTGSIPQPDAILGQKLFLEHDEEEFRKTANFTDLRRTA